MALNNEALVKMLLGLETKEELYNMGIDNQNLAEILDVL